MFALREGALWTPPTTVCLAGVARAVVLGLAKAEGLAVHEAPLSVAEVKTAEELFLTSSLAEVLPVVQLEGSPVKGGAVGPWTGLLRARYRQLAGHA